MENPNILPSKRAVLLDLLAPASRTAATYDTEYFSMADFENLLARIMVGDYTNGSTVNFKAMKAQDGSGTGLTDMTGKAVTELNDSASPVESNVCRQINVNAAELGDDGATPPVPYTHVLFRLVIATAAANTAVTVDGFDARQFPATPDSQLTETIE
jgi:hypothetical protein